MKNSFLSLISAALAAALILAMLGGSMPVSVQAASAGEIKEELKELEKEKAELEEQIKKLQEGLDDTADAVESLIQQKDLIDQEVFVLYQQVDTINRQISAYNEMIAQKQEELDEAREHQAQVHKRNKKRLRAMEKTSATSYWAIILQADSIVDMLDRMKMVEEIRRVDQMCLDEIREAGDLVEQARDELQSQKDALDQTKLELANTQKELEARQAEANALLEQAIAKGAEYRKLLAESEDKQDEIAKKIAEKEKEYNAAGGASGGVGGTGGKWVIPCSYVYMSSPFGNRYHPISGTYTMHYGVDLAAYQGTPIVATRSGTVREATYNSSAGYYVSINHGDGFSSIYMHMTHYVVSYGQKVEQGQVIGYVGSTGGSTGPHLHFGISYNGSYVNPANYINI